MRHIRWKRIAFWAALWWLVYTAPTEDPFARFRGDAMQEQRSDFSLGTEAREGAIRTAGHGRGVSR